jgi:hypothetical protein
MQQENSTHSARADEVFLRQVGETAKREASVYYPAAGLDLDSFVRTGIRRGVFLDPGYFRRRRRPRMTVHDIARKIRRLDAHARFIRPGRRALIATFIAAGRRRRLTFIRGRTWNDEHLAKRHLGSRCVVLIKGCLLPEVLLPPPGIADLKPVAFALDLLHMPPYTTAVRRAYSRCLLERPAQGKKKLIYGAYTCTPSRIARARAEWSAVLGAAT